MTEITEAQVTDPPPAETPCNRTYVPQVLRQRVMQLVHSNPSSGHPGIAATLQLLSNRFWWSTLRTDTITFIQNCTVCNTSKSPHQLPAGLLQPLPIPQRPWSHIAIDFVTDLPASQGHTTILTVIDRFSKACRLIPLPKLPTALETAEVLCNYVFRFYGLREDIVSDRGPQFTSRVWSAFCRQLNINVSLTSGYHPQANGQVVEPRAHPVSTVILPEEPIRLESLSALGRVCPKLTPQASYRHHPLPMHPRLPTSIVSMVRRALRLTGSQLLVTMQ